MICAPYIDVAVVLPVHHTYTYRIPAHLDGQADIGMRVLVPFGRRRVTGFIISGQESDRGYTIKNILDVLDDEPLFTQEMIPWFRWMAAYYIHPLGEVIKTALPSGLDSHDVLEVALKDPERPAGTDGANPARQAVLALLSEKQSLSVRQLSKLTANSAIHSLIRKMAADGIIETRVRLQADGARKKMGRFIHPGRPPDAGMTLSRKREMILEQIARTPGISLEALKKSVPTAPRLIGPMADQGLVTIVEKQVFRDPLGEPVEPDVPPGLTAAQAKAVDRVISGMPEGFTPYLLHGVTGSGKTEVYMRLAAHVIGQGKKVIVLVPEISLISQTERRFRARFQNRVAVIHSGLTKGERLDQWYRILYGKADVVVGARSCVFAPAAPLGLIIVDEEHDGSYKQETGFRYNARDMAVVRARMEGVPVILGSATPSVQSYHNAEQGRFERLVLPSRVNRASLPEIAVVDLKNYREFWDSRKLITPELSRAIRHCLDNGNQALIFLNRRGFASYPVCRDCGQAMACRHCHVTLTFHKAANHFRCHLCGYVAPADSACPECGSGHVKPLGFGTEKIELLLKKKFPDARLVRMDQDTTAGKGQMVKILKSIKNRTVDIIVGTQMLAKGHDFPSITLVGIVCADLALSLPDFRAGERTFQVLAQVAGRAGRGDAAGRVIMQTYTPEHYTMAAAKEQDYDRFFRQEIPFRKALQYPPFTRVILIRISSRDARKAEKSARETAGQLTDRMRENPEVQKRVQLLGPVQSPIAKISSRYRWQILLKGRYASDLNRLVRCITENSKLTAVGEGKLAIDVDPYSLM